MRMDNEQTTRRAFDERGWVRVTEFDSVERRAVWMRDLCDEAGTLIAVEFCAGREGDDHYLYIDAREWACLTDGRKVDMHPQILTKLVREFLNFWGIAYSNAVEKKARKVAYD